MGGYKVGKVTLGFFLIFIGVVWIVQQLIGASLLKYVMTYGWFIILIILVLEYANKYFNRVEEKKISFDGFSVSVLFIFMLISGGIFSVQKTGVVDVFFFLGPENSIEIEEEYEVDDLNLFLMEYVNGSIEVVGEDTSTVHIEGKVTSRHYDESGIAENFEKARKVEEGEGSFEYVVKESSSIFSSNRNHLTIEFVITVPKEALLEIEAVNGSLTASHIENGVSLKTTNGDIEINDVVGHATVRSTNGSLSLASIIGEIEAVTTNGKISVKNVDGKVLARGTNGAIDIESHQVGGDWEIKTTNGKISIDIPKEANVYIEGETSNGSVDGNLEWERKYAGELVLTRRQGSSTLGDGTYSIIVNGTNGGIEVNTH
ncbi:DUF4097 family beta strand repeat-containing protein [Evansella cellulosilytica]|uniref:DUF4097 domain-containing protein n=1 Tax=Evansella cellulosilytica (strain ATCC 21833 / DSM 2522 / FERM P-1141 / JCM 9156 / N-4) TaxID=649639 RepID=E6TV24_EVAC2|nr:DUF4097 family beta strand repeat-containing protein [Evansella cellulosilytica]ADU28607.1 hypothetical protein Bcell_0321 [Evansella cellulosilytica DSM 2522]